MRPYLQHGRRHSPTGSDPIPGLGATTKWAYLSSGGTATTIAPTSNVILTADNTTFYTNDASTFDVQLNAGSIYGIRILADGHYLFWVAARTTALPTAGDLIRITPIGGGSFPDFQFAPFQFIFPTSGTNDIASLSTGGIMCVGGFAPAPTIPITCRIDNGSANTLHYFLAGVVVMQIDTDATDLI